MTKQHIACPNCGHNIDVNEILSHQLQEQFSKEYSIKFAVLEKEKGKLTESIEEGIRKKLLLEKSILEKKLRTEISGENAEAIKSLEEQLEQKSQQVGEANKLKVQLSKITREKNELKEQIEAEAEQKLTQSIAEERTKIRNQINNENELKIAEKDNMVKSLKDEIKQMQRRLEQGSMQAQGEIMELAIEEYLRANFPLDIIDEIKKGARGADCLQTVNTRTGQNCGSIYYESKRTKEFSEGWIEKFKEDMRLKNATIGIIVTDALPRGWQRLGQRDGLWISTYDEFKGLCFVLRETLILLKNSIATQENMGTKMELLYSYLCSTEFQREVEAIVESFTTMSADLISEQRSLTMIWKKRQKQIDKVTQSTIHMYSSIKGIAGDAIVPIQALELPVALEQA